ncbi:hypothetical protein [Patiriisocius hiemis]|uniref:Uncharacterized protein n=1 Tax=Patiriisocius hiemis TaxID=3075604 RepID=A0ABU2YFR3_9FLAO|nr:hypothetical protein [Constantimarinum sp. W242]MDT0556607.1 hypothetical protein [Constantimarinum sp. W242]
MKKLLFLFVFIPFTGFSQLDFETRYFTIDAESLPLIEDLATFSLTTSPTMFDSQLPTFKMNEENYRTPVNMTEALAERQNYITKKWDGKTKATPKGLSFSFSVNGSNSRNGTTNYGVKNSVYQEQRPVYFCSPLDIYRVNQ